MRGEAVTSSSLRRSQAGRRFPRACNLASYGKLFNASLHIGVRSGLADFGRLRQESCPSHVNKLRRQRAPISAVGLTLKTSRKPTLLVEQPSIESFNGRFRVKLLNETLRPPALQARMADANGLRVNLPLAAESDAPHYEWLPSAPADLHVLEAKSNRQN